MFRGTTPTITFNIVTSLDLDKIDKLSVAIENRQGTRKRFYSKEQIVINSDENKLILGLTQDDTLYFSAGKIKIQLKVKMNDGKVYACSVQETMLNEIIDERVM